MGDQRRRTRQRGYAVVAVALMIVLPTLDYWLYPRLSQPGGNVVNQGKNGVWLRFTWYFGQHSDPELKQLAARLKAHGIRYAFFHVRSVGPDGTLVYRYPDKA